jgi:hypothetical protein
VSDRARAISLVASLVVPITTSAVLALIAPRAEASAHVAVVARAAAAAPAARPSAAAGRPPTADSPATSTRPSGEARSPAGPSLTSQPSSDENAGVEAGESFSPQAEADPLVSNGLGSPLCRAIPGAGNLPGPSRRNCETSGFVASGSQTSDFGVDVHIDTGLLGLSSGGLLTVVQDICVTPLWMALVWAVHALLVMLEWCFTLDLLDSSSVRVGLARGLRQMQSAFTIPWLATVLAAASVLTAYNGLLRRRVAETLGQTLLMLAMMAGGFWVMLDPTGTVGALGAWANQASLGTLAATGGAAPSNAGQSLAGGMHAVFSAAIEVPWCYLEFGDVGWCRDPSRLDPRLRAAAIAIASEEEASAHCAGGPAPSARCVARGGGAAESLVASARLLRAAGTNGAIFLALPANGAARNSINERGSLLRTICQSEHATACHGTAAAEAEFRTNHGTWPRVGGLLLIAAGVLGMLLLLGLIALRLLTAALFSLLYLMLTPVVVLAPALGENGRAAFRKWGTQLLGAVVSKLLFSFLLGAVLVVLGIIADLEALGWWTQWLLMSAFWWTAFARRNQALQFAGATRLGDHRAGGLLRRVNDVVEPRRRLRERADEAKQRRRGRLLDVGSNTAATNTSNGSRGRFLPAPAAASGRLSEPGADAQAWRLLDVERRAASLRDDRAGESEQRVAGLSARLERVRTEHATATAAGDARRAASLGRRGGALEAQIASEGDELAVAKRVSDERSLAPSGARDGHAQELERSRFLDLQTAIPGAIDAHRTRSRERRDYVALAGLLGYAGHEFRRLGEPQKRIARLAIDRELALRKSRVASGGGTPETATAARTSHTPTSDDGEQQRWSGTRPLGADPLRPARREVSESSVMRDVREVEAGRKRQLGYDRP